MTDQTSSAGAFLHTTSPGQGLVNGHPAEPSGTLGTEGEVKSAPPPPESTPMLDDGVLAAVKDANPAPVFRDLPLFAYGLIVADPPWEFETYSDKGHGKSAQAHYDCMSLESIKALPVGELAAGDCVLWLWATNPLLRQALDVIAAWGFRYVTAGTWVKTTRTGKLAFGTGYRLRSANEPFLIATNGNPETAKTVRSVIMAEARQHSRKPEEAFAAAEQLVPGVRRLELFSRQSREGWDTWGLERTKFDGAAA